MTFLKKSSLFLQTDLLIPFSPPPLCFLTFLSDYSDVMLNVLSEILHRSGVFVPKRGHFNGNIAAGIFTWPTKYPARSYHLFCCLLMYLLETQRNTSFRSNKDVSFPALPQFTVHENTIASWKFFPFFFFFFNPSSKSNRK